VYISHIQHVIENSSFCTARKSSVSTGFTEQIMLILRILRLRLTTSNFIFQPNTCGYSPYVTSSLTRGSVCRLQLLLVLASAVILLSGTRRIYDHVLLSRLRDSLNLEGQVPVFTSPWNRVAQLYPQALVSLFVASYDSQDYGGGIRPRLHKGDLN
jgi:hypothetical protein